MEDKLKLLKELFILNFEDEKNPFFEFLGDKYTPLEYEDMIDATAIMNETCTFELFEIDSEYLESLWGELSDLDQAGKKIPLALFVKMNLLTPMIILESDMRLVHILNKRVELEESGKTVFDLSQKGKIVQTYNLNQSKKKGIINGW